MHDLDIYFHRRTLRECVFKVLSISYKHSRNQSFCSANDLFGTILILNSLNIYETENFKITFYLPLTPKYRLRDTRNLHPCASLTDVV